MKSYELTQFDLQHLTLVERPEPQPAPGQVKIKLHAASLNYRDLMFAIGVYNPKARLPAIPLSDAAGEIVALGDGVTRWKVGDRVCPIFNQGWLEGAPTQEKQRTTIGAGSLDGVAREFAVFHESGLVAIPAHLSFEEAAALPCAAVTAWNALVEHGNLKSGQTVLTLGTGGVSVFAIQFAKMHGARVIATSSSDEKLARARHLGAHETINYKRTPDWDKEVRRLTSDVGVDHIVEVGGAGTLQKSLNAVRVAGHIALIGVLAGPADFNPIGILMKEVRLQGIFVGSRQMFEDMNRAIELHQLRPVLDRKFPFAELPQAIAYLKSAAHFGKVIIAY
ncbi:MAG: NAD(P)-dependent alcohol dehydrogenase [Candidatus Acidiferrales bacterium]